MGPWLSLLNAYATTIIIFHIHTKNMQLKGLSKYVTAV